MCCWQNTQLQTVTVKFVLFFQCAQHYCNTQCVGVRTHSLRPSRFINLCTFSMHKITVTLNVLCQNTQRPSEYIYLCTFILHKFIISHNVLMSEHTVKDRHSTYRCVCSMCKKLIWHTICCCQKIHLKTVTVKFVMYVQCAQHYCSTPCFAVTTHSWCQ